MEPTVIFAVEKATRKSVTVTVTGREMRREMRRRGGAAERAVSIVWCGGASHGVRCAC